MCTKTRQQLGLLLCVAFWSVLLTALPVGQVYAQGAETVHVVKAGESLAQIAGQYGVSYMQLARHNGITNPNILCVGQRLRIPTATVSTPVAPVQPVEPTSASVAAPTPIQAEVAPTRQVSSPEPQVAPTPTPVITQPRPSNRACGTEISYSVRRGDSLYGIGATYGVSVRTIIARNHLPSTLIYVGQRLIIPLPSCQ